MLRQWEMYLYPSGETDSFAKQLRILAEFGFTAGRVGEHFGQAIVGQFDVDAGELFVVDQILNNLANVLYNHDGLPRFATDDNNVRLFVHYEVSQQTHILFFA